MKSKKVICVVVDANIYVSALLKPQGAASQLIQKGLAGQFQIVLSESIFLEICRVLNYDKIKKRLPFGPQQIKEYLEQLVQIAAWTSDEVKVQACEDPDDDIYLACAQESQADFLVSGDHHLLKMKEFGETVIINLRQLSTHLSL